MWGLLRRLRRCANISPDSFCAIDFISSKSMDGWTCVQYSQLTHLKEICRKTRHFSRIAILDLYKSLTVSILFSGRAEQFTERLSPLNVLFNRSNGHGICHKTALSGIHRDISTCVLSDIALFPVYWQYKKPGTDSKKMPTSKIKTSMCWQHTTHFVLAQ